MLFEEQVAKTPNNTAVIFEDNILTYQQLNEQSNQLADYLRTNYHIQPDDLIALQLPRNEWMVITILATLKAGAAYVPIDPEYPQERIDYTISDSQCKVVIDEKELEKFKQEENKYAKHNVQHINQPNDLAYVIYTSGTTGKPKGTLIEHGNVVRLFNNEQPLFDFTPNDVWTMFHSYCFDFSVWEMYGALLFGGKLVVIPSLTAKDPEAYLHILRTQKVTVLNQTPSSFYNLIKHELAQHTTALQLRYIIFGGEALSPGKLKSWKQKYPTTKLINMYGITETTVHVTYKEITDNEIENNISNIGKPIPTLSCYIFDKHQNLLPIGVAGELYVGGAGVARGYLNRKELTAEKFILNPYKKEERLYRSGDKAKRLINGELEYLGRIDEQVKIRGYRIELGEIEAALQKHPHIQTTVVIAKTNEEGEKELVAYIVSKQELNATDVRSYLSQHLPAYLIPTHYVQLQQIPLTSNGKLDKKALPDPATWGLRTGAQYIAPRNEIEEKLTVLWQKILAKETIGVHDNFFELGGHSLKLTRLAAQVHKLFEIQIELKELFVHTTIEAQAQYITQTQKKGYTAIPLAPQQNDYPLSSSQRRLWVLSQFEESNSAYNMLGVYVLEGNLNIEALQYAFNTVVERHESLRTFFVENEQQEIKQIIQPYHETISKIFYQDLRSKADQPQAVREIIHQNCIAPFDLRTAPLIRTALYQTKNNQWILVYVMHHIISDGWSMEVLINEVLTIYNAYIKKEKNPLVPLHIQYKDYAVWQQQLLHEPSLQSHKQYWLQQFQGELPVLSLLTD
ncbi:MAG TPA: amino acid adenylation domain-containing protein, partial [Chitinophagaceae bacterium]|nr:amino acid adenylation domain-containing protein [Chitinophagaceae bacterium]